MRSDAPRRVAIAAICLGVVGFIFDAPFRLIGGRTPKVTVLAL